MICSEKELGLSDDHSGIMVLPSDALPGTPASEYFNLESDYVIEVDITPNHSHAPCG
jgi:phenylalanyl-tRNA synthetase beta chain